MSKTANAADVNFPAGPGQSVIEGVPGAVRRGGLRPPSYALLLVAVFVTSGCRETPVPASAPSTVRMAIGSETFTLDVADSEAETARGLMYRESMPADRGMIFVFPEEQERSFWMENTLIPLDILYLQASGRVVSVKAMKPRDRTSVPSDGPAMYAVELNRGAADRAGVRAGDTLVIPPEILRNRREFTADVP